MERLITVIIICYAILLTFAVTFGNEVSIADAGALLAALAAMATALIMKSDYDKRLKASESKDETGLVLLSPQPDGTGFIHNESDRMHRIHVEAAPLLRPIQWNDEWQSDVNETINRVLKIRSITLDDGPGVDLLKYVKTWETLVPKQRLMPGDSIPYHLHNANTQDEPLSLVLVRFTKNSERLYYVYKFAYKDTDPLSHQLAIYKNPKLSDVDHWFQPYNQWVRIHSFREIADISHS